MPCRWPTPLVPNAHLYLWVTNSFLGEGLDVMKQWGFTYKTHLVWTKPQLGLGNYFRNSHEVLFYRSPREIADQGEQPHDVDSMATRAPLQEASGVLQRH